MTRKAKISEVLKKNDKKKVVKKVKREKPSLDEEQSSDQDLLLATESNKNCDKSGDESKEILPLNSAVVNRIRLNIGSGLPTSQTSPAQSSPSPNDSNEMNPFETEAFVKGLPEDHQQVPSPLQNIMKSKLANVMQAKAKETQRSGKTTKASKQSLEHDNDTALLNESWSSLDCVYQDLIKSQKRNSKSSAFVSLDSVLWNQFDGKMMELREKFHKMNQTFHKKREKPQNNKPRKKSKA